MKTDKTYYVYIMTNVSDKVLYIGVTNNLQRRIYEHKNSLVEGFSKKYKVNKLVYYETTNDVNSAIAREKQLKNWQREWKIDLITTENPGFADLNIN
ncbi:MAG: GIY-YIG nuclease family protein [Candidatus Pacebacteria bacterium]|nr:GIY-YIG nuclease family protein [Candidatus Paceibacterota bacterium]